MSSNTNQRGQNFKQSFGRTAGLLGAILLVVVLFAITSHGLFLKPANLLGLLRYMSSLAIVGFGLTAVLITGEIDLSFGAVYGLSSMLSGVAWIVWGWDLWQSILLSLCGAAIVGLFNAFFTTIVKIPSFIATLGASTMVFGVDLLVSKSNTLSPLSPPNGRVIPKSELKFFSELSNHALPGGFPMQLLWMLLAAFVFWYLLTKSLFGFHLKAIGGNQVAAEFAKIKVRKYKMWAFVICSVAAASAAILDSSYINSMQPDSGAGLLFPTFAAVVIGGASLIGGRGTVSGTLMGCLLLAILANGLALLGSGAFLQQMFVGAVTIGAVVLDQTTRARRKE